MGRKRKLIDKQAKKHFEKKCYFCDINDYVLLDVHRIIEGGEYTESNTITVCSLCHRKIHANQIKIDRKYFSTNGKWILHYWMGETEFWQ